MYVPDPRISYIPATREQVVSIMASLNKPHIAVPGKAPQEVQAFVVVVGNKPGSRIVFVYLYLTDTREAVVYIDSERIGLNFSAATEAELEAVGFVESMGFILETLNFSNLNPAQQTTLMQSIPCFTKNLKGSGESNLAERAETWQTKMARLFAAF